MVLVSLSHVKIGKGVSMKSRFLFVAAIAMAMAMAPHLVFASEEYVLEIKSGEISLEAAMASAYPDVRLSPGDVIVKKGRGVLLDSADALELSSKLTFVVVEGVLVEGVARQSSTYSVSNGASVVVRVDLKLLSNSIDDLATFNLSGAGTAVYPGALCIDADTTASAQYIVYNLLGDATIYTTKNLVQLSSANKDSRKNNHFTMNGHTLRFAAANSGSRFRFRHPVTFVDAGEIELDGVALSHNSGGLVILSPSSRKIPCVKLRNGARLDCVDSNFAGAIALIDCEPGTKIGGVESNSAEYSIPKITGCPEIASGHIVTVEELYTARAEDIIAGSMLSGEGELVFAPDSEISVESFWTLEKDMVYDVLPVTNVHGEPSLSVDVSEAIFTKGESYCTVAFTGDYSGCFIAFVPNGETYDWHKVTNGTDIASLAGKTLLKLGGGTLAPEDQEDVSAAGLNELVVANGVFRLTEYGHVPENGGKKITVREGATFSFSADNFTGWSTASSPLMFHLAGSGFRSEGGAIVFTEAPDLINRQYATYNLNDDTVLSFPCGGSFNFSSGSETDTAANIFNMNGHSLTFRNPNVYDDSNAIRFRYAVSFNNPGVLVIDNLTLTHLEGARVYVDGKRNSRTLPLKLVNGARLDCVDDYLTDSFSSIDCGEGTCLYAKNKASDNECSFPVLKGMPTISGHLSVMVTDLFVLRCADLSAGLFLDSNGALAFGEDCRMSLDAKPDIDITPDGIIVVRALGGISGKPSSTELDSYRLRTRIGKSDGVDCLFLCMRKGLVLCVQ